MTNGEPLTWTELTRLAVVVLALLYAAGFVVVSASLARYGVRELDALRPRYVAIGTAFGVITAVAVASGLWAVPRAATIFGPKHWWRVPRGAIALLFLVLCGYAVAFLEIYTLLEVEPMPSAITSLGSWINTAAPFGRYNLSIFLILVLVRVAGLDRQLSRKTLTNPSALAGVGAVLAAIFSYATTVFVAVPIWLGGGFPAPVRLSLDQPLLECGECAVEEVQLLDEDGATVVVLTKDGRPIEISRSSIRAIIHPRSTDPLAGRSSP